MIAICLILMVLLAGCSTVAENNGKETATPVTAELTAADQQASNPTEEPAPTPTPVMEEQPQINPVELLPVEDQKIIKDKFTFVATPQTDKKINDGKVKDGVFAADTPPTSYGHKAYVVLTVKGDFINGAQKTILTRMKLMVRNMALNSVRIPMRRLRYPLKVAGNIL